MLRLLLLCPALLVAGEAGGFTELTEKMKEGLPGMRNQPPWAIGRKADIAGNLPFIDAFGQYRHASWPTKVQRVEDLAAQRADEAKDLAANPPPKNRTKWGGWADGPQLEATGRFRVAQHQGRWWWVDPEGRLFWSFGITGVGVNSTTLIGAPERAKWFADAPWVADPRAAVEPFVKSKGANQQFHFYLWNRFLKLGDAQAAIDLDHRRLASWGLTTLANWSDDATCKAGRTPYTMRLNPRAPKIDGGLEHSGHINDPFAPEYASSLKEQAAACSGMNDPWCIGLFVENEMHWGITQRDLGAAVAASSPTQPAKLALRDFLKQRHGGDIAKLNATWGTTYADWDAWLNAKDAKPAPFTWDKKARKRADKLPGSDADLEAFSLVVAEKHFATAKAAIKAVDPLMNYLGCRFNGWAWTGYANISAKYCEVVSANLYFTTVDKPQYLPDDYRGPFMSTEFHFGYDDRTLPRMGLLKVKDAAAQAKALTTYVESALRNPNCIGVHWFQYVDQPGSGRSGDGENFQVGFVDIADRPHAALVGAARALGARLYPTAAGKRQP